MSKRLAPYGNENYAGSVAAVGNKPKSSRRLAARLPSRDIVSKVGEIPIEVLSTNRLVRLKAKG